MSRSLRLWLSAAILSVVLIGATIAAIYYVDPVRIQYKRLTADSTYDYDEIDPRYLETDPAGLITVQDPATLGAARAHVRAAIWGPDDAGADRRADTAGAATLPAFADAPNLDRIEELTASVYDYTAHAFLLVPRRGNGELVVYSHGYAGTFEMHAGHLKRLVAAGYGVLAFNYPGYGKGTFPGYYVHQRFLTAEPYPLRILVEPIVMGLNRVWEDGGYDRVHMMGFSAGGWLTSLVAAVDPRISTSIAVGGSIRFTCMPAWNVSRRRSRSTRRWSMRQATSICSSWHQPDPAAGSSRSLTATTAAVTATARASCTRQRCRMLLTGSAWAAGLKCGSTRAIPTTTSPTRQWTW